MTKENVLLGVATIALASAMGGVDFASELAGSLDKTGDVLRAAVSLSGVTYGDLVIFKLSIESEFGSGEADTVSLSGEFLYAGYLSATANADFDMATGDTSLAITASAKLIQTGYGLFSFGVSIDEDALSASFQLSDISNGFLANAGFGLSFDTDYDGETSLGVNAKGQTIHGIKFTLDADLDLENIDQSNFAIEFSYKF